MAEPVLIWWGGWPPAFALTCVIEVGVYLLMFAVFGLAGSGSGSGSGSAEHSRLGWGRATWLVLGVNVISHPVFWAVALRFDSTLEIVAGELVVVLVEAALVFAAVRHHWFGCLISSLVANAASAVLGSALVAWLTSWAS